ncbi:MAG TPA: primosomal protein [Pseudonocardiaceae bacterium]
MAQDIVPVQLGLTEGDVVTLWAPRWREDGEEWEAFLGHGEHLYVFQDAAELAAFVRTATEHDLTDHPAWRIVPELSADELTPDETQHYDLVTVPELVANDPDQWSVGDLSDVLVMVRSLAEVCDLEVVREVLDSADGFSLVDQGTVAFIGRDGERMWTEMATVVAERWDEVLDAIDGVVTTPELDAAAVESARRELTVVPADADAEDAGSDAEDAEDADAAKTDADDAAEDEDDTEAGFWSEVGIDPILIISNLGEHYTLRCYLDDAPLFLGNDGTIEVFKSPRALAKYLAAGAAGAEGHDLDSVTTWPDVVNAATAGDLEVEVHPDNTYVLTGLADDLAEGPGAVDPTQLDLAVELITDAAQWAGDDSVTEALAQSESLGWLVSFVLRPDPTRLAPSAPFDAEVESWKQLTNDFADRLHVN